MNDCLFIGRTTKDIELRYTAGTNMAVAKFSLAIDSGFGDNKKTNFFNLTAFGKTAETFEKYVGKGTKIAVKCEANQNQYTDKNGNKVNAVDFTVRSFEFCESRSAQTQQTSAPVQTIDNSFMDIISDSDDGMLFK